MRTNESHDKLFKIMYYDEAGFGSITSTFKEANQTYTTVALIYVTKGLNLILKLLNTSKVVIHLLRLIHIVSIT
jgi:hypothetical protein